jgi:hypothetical protein
MCVEALLYIDIVVMDTPGVVYLYRKHSLLRRGGRYLNLLT